MTVQAGQRLDGHVDGVCAAGTGTAPAGAPVSTGPPPDFEYQSGYRRINGTSQINSAITMYGPASGRNDPKVIPRPAVRSGSGEPQRTDR